MRAPIRQIIAPPLTMMSGITGEPGFGRRPRRLRRERPRCRQPSSRHQRVVLCACIPARRVASRSGNTTLIDVAEQAPISGISALSINDRRLGPAGARRTLQNLPNIVLDAPDPAPVTLDSVSSSNGGEAGVSANILIVCVSNPMGIAIVQHQLPIARFLRGEMRQELAPAGGCTQASSLRHLAGGPRRLSHPLDNLESRSDGATFYGIGTRRIYGQETKPGDRDIRFNCW